MLVLGVLLQEISGEFVRLVLGLFLACSLLVLGLFRDRGSQQMDKDDHKMLQEGPKMEPK